MSKQEQVIKEGLIRNIGFLVEKLGGNLNIKDLGEDIKGQPILHESFKLKVTATSFSSKEAICHYIAQGDVVPFMENVSVAYSDMPVDSLEMVWDVVKMFLGMKVSDVNTDMKNEAIALWLGFQKTSEGYFDNKEVLINVERDNTFDFLLFNTDWNWLHVAVDCCSQHFFATDDYSFVVDNAEFMTNNIESVFESVYEYVINSKTKFFDHEN